MFLDSSVSSMVGEGFYKLFVGIIDPVLYSLINPCYKIFDAVARIDIFGTSGGQSVYDTFAGNVYSILSVIMIFVFIYEFLMMLINPDGDAMKSGKSLVKDTLISIIAIILFPVIASYLSIFQRHVLQDNTIQNMILTEGDGNGTLTSPTYDSGDQMSVITLMAFAHPTDYSYSDFYNSNGQPYAPGEACGGAEVCVSTSEALYNWYYNGSDDINSLFAIFEKAIDEGKINGSKSNYSHTETFTYEIIIASVGCIIIVWFLVSYAIDLGTRAIKLGVLEMIAPIPLILKIFPKTKKTFDSWFKMLYKTYLELFVRIAIISITIKLCSIVPLVFQSLSDAITGIEYDSYVKGFAIMCVIIGLLKFAKDLPNLMKELGTGDLFAGLSLKPRGTAAINKQIGGVTGALGGAYSGLVNRTGIRSGAAIGRMNGLKKGGNQFHAQRQAAYEYFGGKGTAGMFGGKKASEVKIDNMKKGIENDTKNRIRSLDIYKSKEAAYYDEIMSENMSTLTAAAEKQKQQEIASVQNSYAQNNKTIDDLKAKLQTAEANAMSSQSHQAEYFAQAEAIKKQIKERERLSAQLLTNIDTIKNKEVKPEISAEDLTQMQEKARSMARDRVDDEISSQTLKKIKEEFKLTDNQAKIMSAYKDIVDKESRDRYLNSKEGKNNIDALTDVLTKLSDQGKFNLPGSDEKK